MEFQIHHTNTVIVSFVILSLIIITLAAFTPVKAGGGSLQLSLQGYGSVPGQLLNAIIQPNSSVSMIMVVNDKIQTSNGPVQITSNGTWTGVRNASAVSGPIRGIVGKAQFCVLFCMSADFVGQGHWYGSLSGSHGTGTFNGTITFTNSPVPQIQNGQPYLISGTWNADFDIPVPEFGPQTLTYMIAAFAFASLLLVSTHRRRNSTPPNNR
jgi:hypothetical protein